MKKTSKRPDEVTITLVAVMTNFFLGILKFAGGVLGNSSALIADSIHSISDLATDFAILFGYKFWNAPPDDNHPYGHHKIEAIITVIISFFLFAASLGMLYKSAEDILHKDFKGPGFIAFIIAIVSILMKEILFWLTSYVGKKTNSMALVANAWHHRSDAFSSVPVAISVGVAYLYPILSFVDKVGAIFVSFIIFFVAYKILRGAFSQLIDEGLPFEKISEIEKIAFSVDGVEEVHALRSRTMSKYIFLDMHVLVDGNISVREGHNIASNVKRRIKEKIKNVKDVIIHIEPCLGKEKSDGGNKNTF